LPWYDPYTWNQSLNKFDYDIWNETYDSIIHFVRLDDSTSREARAGDECSTVRRDVCSGHARRRPHDRARVRRVCHETTTERTAIRVSRPRAAAIGRSRDLPRAISDPDKREGFRASVVHVCDGAPDRDMQGRRRCIEVRMSPAADIADPKDAMRLDSSHRERMQTHADTR
jgi:hypothetical protein